VERGLYAAASGMIAQQTIQDTLAQNIANADTIGYKRDNPTFRALHGMALHRLNNGVGRGPNIGELGTGAAADQVYTDWQTGPLTRTGNALDASLNADQYFTVSTPNGERYTRAGNMRMDGQGNLLLGGLPVLDTNNRPINAAGSTNLTLDGTGNLLADGQPVAQLKIVQAGPDTLTKDGNSLFSAKNPALVLPAAQPGVQPGTLEQSNVDTVHDLVQMITISRGFEIAQRAVITQDDMLKHAANDLGRL
jgi:flagellar basal-body rod protein FlgF